MNRRPHSKRMWGIHCRCCGRPYRVKGPQKAPLHMGHLGGMCNRCMWREWRYVQSLIRRGKGRRVDAEG